jgi:hypothetical protein
MEHISDAALTAFIDWVRFNDARFTRDPAMVRRVFTAYADTDRDMPQAPEVTDD